MPDTDDPVLRGDDDVAIAPIDIQFDQAEYTTPTPDGPSCGVCQSSINGEYYETGGKVCCPSCRDRVEAAFRGGSRVARVLKAFLFGSVAAGIGAALYYAIQRATGYNIGLVAVVVGVMVGRAVRKGTGDRGGRFYQFLAVFLTYSAIASMYAPLVVQEFLKQAQVQEPAEAPIAKVDKADAKPDAELTDPKQIVLAFVVVAVVVIGFSYILPVQIALTAPMSGLIFAFALWEAWKVNRRAHLSFNGPFRVSTPGSSGPEPEVERDGE